MDTSAIQQEGWDNISTLIAIVNAWLQFLLTIAAISESTARNVSEKISFAASNRNLKGPRVMFSELSSDLSDTQFKGMFRMDRQCFHELCTAIENSIGQDSFKSEEYLKVLEKSNDRKGRMYRAHIVGSGGYISGELKVALSLRILGGGSYWDVSHIFGVHERAVPKIFYDVVREWFCSDAVSPLIFDETICSILPYFVILGCAGTTASTSPPFLGNVLIFFHYHLIHLLHLCTFPVFSLILRIIWQGSK
jgi:hypothetical protein